MKVRILRTPLAIALLGGMSISVCYAAVSVSLVPLREVYHPGEPVAVLLSLKNTGRVPVEIPISGCPPDASAIGLTFRCPPGVEPVPLPWEVAEKGPGPNAPVVLYSRDRYMPLVRILPKKEYRLAVALNKYMRFVATGRHVIRYSAKYPGFIQNDPGSRTLTGITLPEVKGEIAIVIKAGAIDEKWIKSLIAILKGPGKAPPPDAAQGEEQISREDAAGLLVWADTPIVIEPLIAAAEDPSMPNVPAIVIPSLQKFYRKHEHAREAILEIAQKTGTLRNAIATLDKEGVTIPGRSFKPIFASKSILNIWPALEYIRAHGTRDDVEAVEPLVNNDFSPPIGQLAAAVVKDLKARPPAKAPAAPGKRKSEKEKNDGCA